MPPRPRPHYDSESEDQPREVLDVDGDFVVKDSDLAGSFKLRDFKPMVQDRDGKMIPFSGVISLRPVPDPQTVSHAQSVMGNGENGVWTGTLFTAPADAVSTPQFMFPTRLVNSSSKLHLKRFCIRRRFVPALSPLKTMLIYTDGACPSNGQDGARGTFGFVYHSAQGGAVSGAMEQKGPDGQIHQHTNNRAELRAVLAALRFRGWWGEGWSRLVIVTDSEYVGKGSTEWMRSWARRGWRTSGGGPVANRDLWEALSEKLGEYAAGGCEVSFRIVPRKWNELADKAAKAAAGMDSAVEYGGGDVLGPWDSTPRVELGTFLMLLRSKEFQGCELKLVLVVAVSLQGFSIVSKKVGTVIATQPPESNWALFPMKPSDSKLKLKLATYRWDSPSAIVIPHLQKELQPSNPAPSIELGTLVDEALLIIIRKSKVRQGNPANQNRTGCQSFDEAVQGYELKLVLVVAVAFPNIRSRQASHPESNRVLTKSSSKLTLIKDYWGARRFPML
ncbi:ribonuclease H-like domain-containing protein [Roridomyces roridus]|uniref:ribonuclease H n=1 Tax=Roridomyces roridus TaxID=1738132 RepID=A0AAD7B7Y2_9AGAR|nr:ribonuclease H-like domain-containing protein [Roridomyces roridus]